MKTILLWFVLAFSAVAHAQRQPVIDSSNYYKYYSNGAHLKARSILTAWLTDVEAIPVIAEEFKKAGLETDEHQLYQLPGSQMIVVSVYSRKPEFGIIYDDGSHAADPVPAHRTAAYWVEDAGSDGIYNQVFRKVNGDYDHYYVKTLPPNIVQLRQDCYWYQSTNVTADNAGLVTKQVAIRILRQDVRAAIARVKQK